MTTQGIFGSEDIGVPEGGRGRVRALLIAGPTASGKSALAVAVAARHGGVVVNADSMQVYASLPILSSQPGASDVARAPHALFGHRDPGSPYSVGRWLAEAEAVLTAAEIEGRLAIVVGGTGLYFKALTQGLSAIPPVPDVVRTAVRREAEGVPAADLHRILAAEDPAGAARLRPTDPQRILRALEVVRATGRSLTAFQAAREAPILAPSTYAGIVLRTDRAALNARIDARFDAMMAAGALDEAKELAARDLDPALPAMRALGVPPLLASLRGELSLVEAVARAKAQTRAYAKRQETFARHQLRDFDVLSPDEALERFSDAWPGG